MIRSLSVLAGVLALVAAACTTTSATTIPEASAAFPVTIDAPNGPVTLDQRPTNVVSLSPTATEVLCSIEMAGDKPSMESTSGFSMSPRNCRAYADNDSTYLRWPSA